MRVAFLTYDFEETGGQGRFSQGLVSALRADGVDVDVIQPATTHSDRLSRAATRFGKGPGFSFLVNLHSRSILESGSADLIHVNGGPGGVLIPRSQACPVVYTAHHTYAQQASLVGGQGWKLVLALMEKRSYEKAHSIAAVSRSTADSIVTGYKTDPSKVAVVPNGLDFGLFRPAPVSKSPRTCLFVGRLDARKGFLHLIKAWPRVVERLPSSKLLVIGNGPERLAAEKYLAQEGIVHTVTFLGRVDSRELVRLYSEAQCVAVPSVFEGFGLAALEALACGTRVVARNVDGLRDVITDDDLGRLVAPNDIDALADAIVDEFDHPRGINSRTRARLVEKYDWTVVERQYRELYADALR